MLFMNVGRTYDTTSVVQYDLFTKAVVKNKRIVCMILSARPSQRRR